jgi:hypothetical protein
MGRLIQLDLLERIKQLDQDKLLREVWDDTLTQDYIIELNTIEQLFKESKKSDDSLLPIYALSSYKRAKGQLAPTDRINLRLTGDFYKSFDVLPNSTGFDIDANTNLYPDSGDFIEIYGPEILGLTEDSLEKLRLFVKDLLNEKIRLFLNLD